MKTLIFYILLFFLKIAKHLTKLFDSMADLKFEQDGDDNDTKNALGMYSKDSEYVDFPEICDCNGQVCKDCFCSLEDTLIFF